MVSLAYDLVEQRLRDGTASATETVQLLKLGSSRERLEQERLRHENELLQVKREAIEGQKQIEELYRNAILAMNSYSGREELPEDEYGG